MTPELLKAARERDRQEGRRNEIEIWPDMAAGVLTFFALDTQWKRGPVGEVVGLDYGVVKATADLLRLTLDVQAFHDIRIMENETLRTLKEKRR